MSRIALKPLNHLAVSVVLVESCLAVKELMKHLLTHLFDKISAHLVDDRHILKAIALGDVAAPD